MVAAFKQVAVTPEMIEKRLQHKLSETGVDEMIALRTIYRSIKDGQAKRDAFFNIKEQDVSEALKKPVEKPAKKPAKEKKPEPKLDSTAAKFAK